MTMTGYDLSMIIAVVEENDSDMLGCIDQVIMYHLCRECHW